VLRFGAYKNNKSSKISKSSNCPRGGSMVRRNSANSARKTHKSNRNSHLVLPELDETGVIFKTGLPKETKPIKLQNPVQILMRRLV
jgi:hypothetical protein